MDPVITTICVGNGGVILYLIAKLGSKEDYEFPELLALSLGAVELVVPLMILLLEKV